MSYEQLAWEAQEFLDPRIQANEPEAAAYIRDLARAVLEQKETIERRDETIKHLVERSGWFEGEVTDLEEEIERLQSELRIEKASQATRGNN